MTGESKRLKVRARWYEHKKHPSKASLGIQNNQNNIQIEVKRKLNSLSDKITNVCSINTEMYPNQLGIIKAIEETCNNAINSLNYLSFPKLYPTVCIKYERKYFQSSADRNIRLTIDENQYYSPIKENLKMTRLSDNYLIVEIKYPPNSQKKALDLFSDFPFRRVRSSKYISAIAQIKRVSY